MRRFAHGLVAAMENENLDTPPGEGSAVPAEAPAESAETELIDVNEGAAEGEAVDAAVEEAVDAAATMEGLITGLESFKDKGGLTEQGAWGVHQTIAHINKRLGTNTKIPAMESFAAPSSRMSQHRVALESIKDTLARIWKAIKEAIKKSIQWVQDQFEKLFGAATKLKKRAEALEKAANGISGTMKEKDFENDRIAKALSINGNAPTDVPASLAHVKQVGDFVFKNVSEFNAGAAEAVITVLEAMDISKLETKPFSAGQGFANVDTATASKLGYAEAGADMAQQSSGEMPGNKAILVRHPVAGKTGEEAATLFAKANGTLITYDGKQKEVSNTKVKTLAGDDIEKIAKTVVEICDAILGYKAKLPKAKELKSKLVNAADKAEKAALKEEDEKAASTGKLLAKVTHNAAATLDKPAPQFQAYALNTCKAALDYCDLSLKQYGSK